MSQELAAEGETDLRPGKCCARRPKSSARAGGPAPGVGGGSAPSASWEAAGLVGHRRQATTVGSDGVLRPDMIVNSAAARSSSTRRSPPSALWQEDPADRVSEGPGTWAGTEVSQRTHPSGAQAAAHTKALKGPGSRSFVQQGPASASSRPPDFPCRSLSARGVPAGVGTSPGARPIGILLHQPVVIATPTTLLSLPRVVAIGLATAGVGHECRRDSSTVSLLVERPSLGGEAVGHHGDSVGIHPCRVQRTHRGWQGRGSTHDAAHPRSRPDTGEQAELAELATPVRAGYPRPRRLNPDRLRQ